MHMTLDDRVDPARRVERRLHDTDLVHALGSHGKRALVDRGGVAEREAAENPPLDPLEDGPRAHVVGVERDDELEAVARVDPRVLDAAEAVAVVVAVLEPDLDAVEVAARDELVQLRARKKHAPGAARAGVRGAEDKHAHLGRASSTDYIADSENVAVFV